MIEIDLKHELAQGGYTCVAFDEEGAQFYSSYARGIVPLYELCEKNAGNKNLLLADKITGKAAALLSIKCGATKLYTQVITKDALSILNAYKIDIQYEKEVPYIKNRTGKSKCPMEGLANGVSSPDIMLKKIKVFLAGVAKTPANNC